METGDGPTFRGAETGPTTTRHELCAECERETDQEIFVHVFVESARRENEKFSRQPYRVSVCTECGTETLRRLNQA